MYSTFNQGKDRWDEDTTLGRSTGSSARLVAGRFRLHQVPAPFHQPSLSSTAPSAVAQSHEGTSSFQPSERTWLLANLLPSKASVEALTDGFIRRWTYLLLYPTLLIWVWVAVPFPHTEQDDTDPTAPRNVNFPFFLLWFFGGYLCASLLFITALFNLFRVNWWPKALGGKLSYLSFWALTLAIGAFMHHFNIFGARNLSNNDTTVQALNSAAWTLLAVFGMSLPAWACFIKMRKDRRQTFRNPLTLTQRTFLERQLTGRIPRSYKRFIWFLVCIAIALTTLTAGQSFSAVYLSTLPHSSLDGIAYVWTWMGTVQLLHSLTSIVLESKVRSKALLSVFRYYYYLTEFIFVRTLFARLRSPDQFVAIQAAQTLWVIVFQPTIMSKPVLWIMQQFGYSKSLEVHQNLLAICFYLRNLASNVTMFCFLGYLTILHFGPNKDLFPFFRLDHPTPEDPYNYRLTALASLGIWASELLSACVARQICFYLQGVDVTNAGLNEMRNYPELVPALTWTSVHVLSDILLFLVKLSFR